MSRTSIRLMLDEGYRDCTRYRDKGWFDSDFFYPVRPNPLKKPGGRNFDVIAANAAGKYSDRRTRMKQFITDDFLLQGESARRLFHDFAKDLPIIDYHNHLNPEWIAKPHNFENITEVWLGGDHYKWRAMRTHGIDEKYITGSATPREKFRAWAAAVPATLRNPLYHWTHLELARYFGIYELLNEKTADAVFDACNERLKSGDLGTHAILKNMKVELLCTTDDPVDTLEHHREYQAPESGGFKLYPAWRPDRALKIHDMEAFNEWVDSLGRASGMEISSCRDLMDALKKRHDYFHECGCRLSDYGLETVYAENFTGSGASRVFEKARKGKEVSLEEMGLYRSAVLHDCFAMDHSRGWTCQLHIGVLRNNNTRYFGRLGPDSGFDSIGDFRHAVPLARFLDSLDREERLSKTVIYPINPGDYEMVATMIGNFQEGPVRGRMQFGSGWWFMDQKHGIERQFNDLSNMGLLSTFIGMTTDSRSFLSFPRHEYFRRILCNLVGNDMEQGLIPDDFDLAGKLVEDICYRNAKEYFSFG